MTSPLILIDNIKKYEDEFYEIAKEYVGKDCCTARVFLQRILKLEKTIFYADALEFVKENPLMFKLSYLPGCDKNDPVISFSKPNIMRKTGNNDKNTFDFVSVEILLRSDLDLNDIAAFAKEHLRDFDSRVREVIDNYKPYQKFGVPVEFLSLYGGAVRGKSCLEFKYELKEI